MPHKELSLKGINPETLFMKFIQSRCFFLYTPRIVYAFFHSILNNLKKYLHFLNQGKKKPRNVELTNNTISSLVPTFWHLHLIYICEHLRRWQELLLQLTFLNHDSITNEGCPISFSNLLSYMNTNSDHSDIKRKFN